MFYTLVLILFMPIRIVVALLFCTWLAICLGFGMDFDAKEGFSLPWKWAFKYKV
jgi:hypothetical protein